MSTTDARPRKRKPSAEMLWIAAALFVAGIGFYIGNGVCVGYAAGMLIRPRLRRRMDRQPRPNAPLNSYSHPDHLNENMVGLLAAALCSEYERGRAEEREECAQLVENEEGWNWKWITIDQVDCADTHESLQEISAAIRARSSPGAAKPEGG